MKGFSITLNTTKYSVKFKTHNQKIVICEMFPVNSHGLEKERYYGKAKLNPVDTFSSIEGHKLAFKRALDQRNRFVNSKLKRVNEKFDKFIKMNSAGLEYRFNKLIKMEEEGK